MRKALNTYMPFENAHLDALLMTSTLLLYCFAENLYLSLWSAGKFFSFSYYHQEKQKKGDIIAQFVSS